MSCHMFDVFKIVIWRPYSICKCVALLTCPPPGLSPMCVSAGINRSPASRGPGPNLPHHACRLPAGRGRPDGGAHADVHQQRGQRRHRHALQTEPVPAADPRRLLLHRQHGPVRGIQEAAHAPAEPGKGGGRLLHPARPRLRDPQAHAGRRVLQPDGTHRPGGRISLSPAGKVSTGLFCSL